MRVEFGVAIAVFGVLKEEGRETARAVSGLVVLWLIDNAARRSVSMRIGRIRGRRKEFRTGSARAEVVEVRGRLGRSSEESESTSMLDGVRYSYGLAISSLYEQTVQTL